MKSNKRLLSLFISLSFLATHSLQASQPKPKVKIEFQKTRFVQLGERTQIIVTIEALEELDSADVRIEIPARVVVHSGVTGQRIKGLKQASKVHLPLVVSVRDSVMDRITITVETKKDGIQYGRNADLYLISYDGEVEIMDQKEVSDQSKRYWKATPTPENVEITPISYEDSFIQLGPGEEPAADSVNFEFDDGKPFVIRLDAGGGGLSKQMGEAATAAVNTTVYGYIYFKDSNGTPRPFVNSTVEIWEDDVLFDDYLGSTTTNASGYFSKSVSGGDLWPDNTIEIYLQLKTKNSKVVVYEPVSVEPHRWLTNYKSTSGANVYFNVTIGSGSYAACSIFHWMNESWTYTNNNGYDPGKISALYPNGNGSYYSRQVFPFSDYGAIYIETGDWHWGDEDITRHEYGHALMHHAQNKWWPSNTDGSHSFWDVLHPNFAWTEGWATAYTQFVDPDGVFNAGWTFNIENQTSYYNLPTDYTNEARVAAAVSDLRDSNQDGDDYSSIAYSKIINAIRNNNNDHLKEFWGFLKWSLTQSEKHYGSRALRYNTINVPLEPLTPPPPPAPTGLVLGNEGEYDEAPWLYWNSSAGATSYKVYRRFDGGSWVYVATTSYLGYDDYGATVNWDSDYWLEYYVTAVNAGGESGPSNIVGDWGYLEKKIDIPRTFALEPNYPNPFNPATTIRYDLPEASRVSLVIYNIAGQEVRSWNLHEQAGHKQVVWGGKDRDGSLAPAGIYIYRLVANSIESDEHFAASRKMLLLK